MQMNSIEMTKLKQLENSWKKEFDETVKPAVDVTHGIDVPNEIWNIILQYTMSNDNTGYIKNQFNYLVTRQRKLLMCLNRYLIFRMLLEVFLLFSSMVYYFYNLKLYSNQYHYNSWQEYQMLNAMLSVSYFIPNPLFMTLLIADMYMYVWSTHLCCRESKPTVEIFIFYNLSKYLLQTILGLPLYFVGLASLWFLMVANGIIGFSRSECECKSYCGWINTDTLTLQW